MVGYNGVELHCGMHCAGEYWRQRVLGVEGPLAAVDSAFACAFFETALRNTSPTFCRGFHPLTSLSLDIPSLV